MSHISPAEFELESGFLQLERTDFSVTEVRHHLMATADKLGSPPQFVQGGRHLEFWWHVGERLVLVSPRRRNPRTTGPPVFELTMHSLDWQNLEWWASKASGMEHETGPRSLWQLAITERRYDGAGFDIMDWSELFEVFTGLESLPTDLELIPPPWRESWWAPSPGGFGINFTGPELPSVTLTYAPGEVSMLLGPDEEWLTIPADHLGRAPRFIDLAAVFAGQTATGALSELCFINENFSFTRWPQGPACGDPDGPPLDDDQPPRTQSLADVRRILADGPDPAPPRARRSEPEEATRPTLTPEQAVDACVEMLDRQRGAQRPSARVDLVPGRVERHDAYEFAGAVNRLMAARFGEPESVTARSNGHSVRRWRCEHTAVSLSVLGLRGLTIDIEPWDDMERTFTD